MKLDLQRQLTARRGLFAFMILAIFAFSAGDCRIALAAEEATATAERATDGEERSDGKAEKDAQDDKENSDYFKRVFKLPK